MTTRINRNDQELLVIIAEYEVLTVQQLAAINHRSPQVIRRRLRALEAEAVTEKKQLGYGKTRGRPEEAVGLTKKGVDFLFEYGVIEDHSLCAKERQSPFIEHELLINWFRIHLLHVEESIPNLVVSYLKPTAAPFAEHHKDRSNSCKHNTAGNSQQPGQLIPDGIVSITEKETMKTLLFFLEVDMGTETLASTDRKHNDVRQKILSYQELFRNGRYKAYENTFKSKLNGFRLLFLSNTNARLTALCRLAKQMPPSDFIWLTDQDRMFSKGLAAAIWSRGGRNEDAPQSILGPKLACHNPLT